MLFRKIMNSRENYQINIHFRIHDIQAHGFPDKWFNKMFYDYADKNDTKIQSCIHDQWNKIDSINYIELKNMRTCFYLLGCGIGFAVLTFICEIIVKLNTPKNAKNDYKKNNMKPPRRHYNNIYIKQRLFIEDF